MDEQTRTAMQKFIAEVVSPLAGTDMATGVVLAVARAAQVAVSYQDRRSFAYRTESETLTDEQWQQVWERIDGTFDELVDGAFEYAPENPIKDWMDEALREVVGGDDLLAAGD